MQDLTWNYLTNPMQSATVSSGSLAPSGSPGDAGTADPGFGIDGPGPTLWSDPGAPHEPPPPPLSMKWVKLGETRFAPWLALALVSFGVLAEFVVRTDPPGLVGAVLGVLGVMVARLAASGREGVLHGVEARVNRWSRDGAAVIGIGASIGLLWRATPTLRILDLLAILVSVVLVSDVWLRASMLVVRRMVLAMIEPVAGFFAAIGLAFGVPLAAFRRRFRKADGITVRATLRKRSDLLGRVFAGLILAVPIVVVLGMLLASADAVFASFFRMPEVDLSGLGPTSATIGRMVLFALLLAAPIVAGAAREPVAFVEGKAERALGRVEALVVFTAVNVLFGLFCIAQLVTLSGGAKRVLNTSGLTYAEYARSGFFQLVAVSLLTLVVLGTMRSLIGEVAASDNRVRMLSALTAVLTLAITFVALSRMSLYMRAYGLTVDRIVAQAGTITIGCVFLLVLFSILRSRPGRDLRGSTTAGSIGIAALAIFVLHVVNPSAWSMRDGFARGNVVAADMGAITRDDARGSTMIEIDNDSLPVVTTWLRDNPSGEWASNYRTEICNNRVSSRAWYQWEWSAMNAELRESELCDVSF
jgi:Domain of unknown function (DUF4173)